MSTLAERPGRSLRIGAQFLAMGLVWGASFLFMKVGLGGVSFTQVVVVRLVCGAVTLGVIVAVTRSRLPREPVVWLHFLVLGITYCVLPYLLFAWAETEVSSSLASIYNAVTPIATAVMATAAFRIERLAAGQILGVGIGIIGVVVVVGPWNYAALSGSIWGQLACLGAVTCYGFSYCYLRKYISHRDVPAATSAFLNIGMGAAVMLVASPMIARAPVRLDLPVVASLLALGVLGTGVVYIWNMNVLRAWGPTATSGVTYVTPVVGVALGVLVLGDRLGWNEPIGAAVILIGILFAQRRIELRRPPARAARRSVPEGSPDGSPEAPRGRS